MLGLLGLTVEILMDVVLKVHLPIIDSSAGCPVLVRTMDGHMGIDLA